MDKEIKNLLSLFLSILLILVLLSMMLICLMAFGTYLEYIDLNEEGYKVRWSFASFCEIKVKNIDGGFEWMHCQNIGNEYSLENFAVRKSK